MRLNRVILSEMKEIIKPIPKGKKIKPLTIKKIVNKPYIEKIEQENGSIITIMKQKSITNKNILY